MEMRDVQKMLEEAQGGGEVIYVDEAKMMHSYFDEDWPRYLYCLHEMTEQIYAEMTGMTAAGK